MLVAPADAEAIAQALERLRGEPWEKLAEAARRSAEPFTYAAQAAGFERIYAEIPIARGDFR